MKQIFILALSLLPFLSAAQTTTPKIRIEERMFSTRYEIGDKTTNAKDLALHLKKHDADAYIKWASANRSDRNALLWSIVGLGGVLVGVLSEEQTTQAGGYLVGALGTVFSIGYSIGAKHKREKAIDIYNRRYGY